jgi:hypothetical protein
VKKQIIIATHHLRKKPPFKKACPISIMQACPMSRMRIESAETCKEWISCETGRETNESLLLPGGGGFNLVPGPKLRKRKSSVTFGRQNYSHNVQMIREIRRR